jgi:GNAT superfamily N-acetyltransferase
MDSYINTNLDGFKIRFAKEYDVPVIRDFIKQLAEYEKLSHEMTASEEVLRESLFKNRTAEVIIAEYRGHPVGFALFFLNFSTFLGKPGVYLEDIYIIPEMRGKGYGKAMLLFLAKLTADGNFGRLEWACLDWNEPAIEFYKNLGAEPLKEWTTYRLTGESLRNLAEQFKDK